jgi:hypothetical protein
MGQRAATLAAVLLPAMALFAGCAEAPVPQAVAPSLPPAAIQQVTVLNTAKCVRGRISSAQAPCVIDLQKALKATPEAREFLANRYSSDAPEYYMLLQRANDRLQNAIQKVAGRHAFDLVMERGSLVLKADQSEVMIADITNEVVFEVSR